MPDRIQRRRTSGWQMPSGAIYVGRPSRYGNPFPVTPERDAAAAVELFRWLVRREDRRAVIRAELAGRDLACWCGPDQPCHADVLLEIANTEGAPE